LLLFTSGSFYLGNRLQFEPEAASFGLWFVLQLALERSNECARQVQAQARRFGSTLERLKKALRIRDPRTVIVKTDNHSSPIFARADHKLPMALPLQRAAAISCQVEKRLEQALTIAAD